MSFFVAQKTLERIEWTQLVDLWAAQCRTPQARDLLLAQRASASLFATSAGDAAERLAMTSELLQSPNTKSCTRATHITMFSRRALCVACDKV